MDALSRAASKRNLGRDEMKAALGAIMDGDVEPVPMAAFLTALVVKGETDEEVIGAVEAMRERAMRIEPAATELLDTCGTGGDGASTFNISNSLGFSNKSGSTTSAALSTVAGRSPFSAKRAALVTTA